MGHASDTKVFPHKAEGKPISVTESEGQEGTLQSVAHGSPLRMCPGWFLGKLFCLPGGRRAICKQKLMCYGKKCYYFSHEAKNFEDSRKFCDRMASKLVKIEDEQELVTCISSFSFFIMCICRYGLLVNSLLLGYFKNQLPSFIWRVKKVPEIFCVLACSSNKQMIEGQAKHPTPNSVQDHHGHSRKPST